MLLAYNKLLLSKYINNITFLTSFFNIFLLIGMKSIQINKYGGSNVIEINQNTPHKLLSDKILVDIKADGVNPIDWKIREGYMQDICNKWYHFNFLQLWEWIFLELSK